MTTAHGDNCDDFPPPAEPAEYSPFFGKYANTGAPSTGQYYGPGTTDDSGTTDDKYDPRFYENAPLDPPPTETPQDQAPPEAPSPGNGNGNGIGNGNGQPGGGVAPG
jgi:hypothetical protein